MITMKNEVVKQENEVALSFGDLGQFVPENQTAEDILMASILPMNPSSKFVMDGKAVFGELRNSLTEERLAGVNEKYSVIPICIKKQWIVSRMDGGRWVFDHFKKFEEQPNAPYETEFNGVKMKNELVYVLYCLDKNDPTIPVVLNFKGMSRKSGQKIWTMMYTLLRAKGLPPFHKEIDVVPTKEKNDKGTFVILNVSYGETASKQNQETAFFWWENINKNKVTVTEHQLPVNNDDNMVEF